MISALEYFFSISGASRISTIFRVKVCSWVDVYKRQVVYYGERIHVEGAVFAEQLIRQGAVGRVLQVTILAPHRLNRPVRPDWFFEKQENGGIITDLGSHQIEQFLTYCGAKTARVLHSAVANYGNRDKKDFYDFGEASLLADNGATCWFRVDWFTPDGLGAWGDGRVFIMGTEGSICLLYTSRCV